MTYSEDLDGGEYIDGGEPKMADPELDAIRARRLAELKGVNNANDNAAEQAEQKKKVEDARNSMLTQILDQTARARLNILKAAKPDTAQLVENFLLQMAQSRPMSQKVTESEIIHILENVTRQVKSKKPTIKYNQRRIADDSDDDLD